MRPSLALLALLACLVIPVALACNQAGKSPTADAAPDGPVEAAAPSASEAPEASAPASSAAATHALHPAGPPVAGNACTSKEGVNGFACAPGGFEELACQGGVWKVLETCRGAAGCKVEPGAVHCDPGTPVASDACVAGSAPRCQDMHSVLQCESGKWVSSLCVPPARCVPVAKNGAPGCK